MKILAEASKFSPITVTIESEEDLALFTNVLKAVNAWSGPTFPPEARKTKIAVDYRAFIHDLLEEKSLAEIKPKRT